MQCRVGVLSYVRPIHTRLCNLCGYIRTFGSGWKQQRDSDLFADKAIAEGLRSRAAYKLDEIDNRFGRFLRQGANVIDLGASPGGFSLIASRRVVLNEAAHKWDKFNESFESLYPPILDRTLNGQQRKRKFGSLICVDKQEMEPIPGAQFIHGDFLETKTQELVAHALRGTETDVFLSDMAPSTTGDPCRDHDNIMILAENALSFAKQLLRNGGTFVCKIFRGSGEEEFRQNLRNGFVKVKAFKPKASRKHSREIYYVAAGFVPEHLRASPSRACTDASIAPLDDLVDDFRKITGGKCDS